jgi:hypothetical protein
VTLDPAEEVFDHMAVPVKFAVEADLMTNDSPHVVILGAGASAAACPRGDRYGRKLPTMANLAEVVGLVPQLRQAGITDLHGNFEVLYQQIADDDRLEGLRRQIEDKVHSYFAALRLPDEVTVYDQLVLSLRAKDVIATFNWDPLLLQACARNRLGGNNLPMVLFLHGNVYQGHCPDHRTVGYLTQKCNTCGRQLQPSRLLYPITNKNYRSDWLLEAQWGQLSVFLEHAYLLTIFGYAAPTSDAAARETMLKAWTANQSREIAIVSIVDIIGKRLLEKRWSGFGGWHGFGCLKRFSQTYLFHYPRRSCEAYAFASLQQDPWAERKMPYFRSLKRLQDWIYPLIAEEHALEAEKRPFKPFTSSAS